MQSEDRDRVLTPAEVAEMFKVNPKTVTRYAAKGMLPYFTTPGGHHRFYLGDVIAMINKSKGGRS